MLNVIKVSKNLLNFFFSTILLLCISCANVSEGNEFVDPPEGLQWEKNLSNYLPIKHQGLHFSEVLSPNIVVLSDGHERVDLKLVSFQVMPGKETQVMEFLESYIGKDISLVLTKDDQLNLIGCIKVDDRYVFSHLIESDLARHLRDKRVPECDLEGKI